MGFGTNNNQTAAADQQKKMITYNVEVTDVRLSNKDTVCYFDMKVNGIIIRDCVCIEYKNKEGNTGFIIDFPRRAIMDSDKIKKNSKGEDMYMSYCFFPITKELRLSIVSQINSKVDEMQDQQ